MEFEATIYLEDESEANVVIHCESHPAEPDVGIAYAGYSWSIHHRDGTELTALYDRLTPGEKDRILALCEDENDNQHASAMEYSRDLRRDD